MNQFTARVYKVVLSIPLGEVRTYQWVARSAGNPNAARAVGQIMKNNPYPLIIPCHRVVGAGNKIGGYSRGVRLKKRLLSLESKMKLLGLKPEVTWSEILSPAGRRGECIKKCLERKK